MIQFSALEVKLFFIFLQMILYFFLQINHIVNAVSMPPRGAAHHVLYDVWPTSTTRRAWEYTSDLHFHPLEVVSRYRDTQLQVGGIIRWYTSSDISYLKM